MKNLIKMGIKAKSASSETVSEKIKNKILLNFLKLIRTNKKKILIENKKDVSRAIRQNLKENMIKRLELNEKKIKNIESSIKNIIKIKDPTNKILKKWLAPSGLNISQVTIPIGVIGIIYESRPNVTADISCLCFKSGNSVILRGGSEAYNSNKILSKLFRKSLKSFKVNENFVQFINIKDRKVVKFILSKMNKYIDVLIPRGGKGLVKTVQKFSNIPIIGHLEGVCHTFIDKNANLKMAQEIVLNAKMRNTSICGATETLLIHEKVLRKYINPILSVLEKENCEIYADKKARKFYKGKTFIANENDWSKEYLTSKISVKTVKNVSDAVRHINKYGTMHTDAIVTKDNNAAKYFLRNVKSSIAIHNSSTQFADGGEFGFGGEVGISTNKLPPRGPVGLNQLVTYKYEVRGKGQIRK